MRIASSLLLLLALAGCSGGVERLEQVPGDLHGRWTTRSDAHGDRFFELGASTLKIGTGGTRVEIHAVTGVEVEAPAEGRTPYRVLYNDEHGDSGFLLRFEPERAAIYLGASDVPWTRTRL